MLRVAGVLAIAGAILAGCAAPAAEPTATPDQSGPITVDGVDRTYLFTAPAEADAPLVVMLHGGGDDAVIAKRDYGWEDIAVEAGIAVAYPDGIGGSWNAGGCCDPAVEDGVDDVAFLAALVDQLIADYAIDPDRVYVTGFSNGGLMAYRLACETDLFAAIAPVGATLVTACDDPDPTSVLAIHGDADKIVPLSGQIPNGTAYVNGMPIDELNAFWRTVDGCGEPVDGFATCADGREVGLILVPGLGHEWPADATATIWSFFDAH